MRSEHSGLQRFAFGLLVFIPLTLASWWFLASDILVWALQPLTEWTFRALWPQWGLHMEPAGQGWIVETTLPILGRPLQSPAISVPATRFTVAFALFWALVLATPGAQRGRQLASGTLLALTPLVLLMLVLYVQFQLALIINHQPILASQPPAFYVLALPYPQWQYHLIGVGRQLALLVLPTLGPLMIWMLFNRPFLHSIVGEGLLARLQPQQPLPPGP